jgi:AraC family transcriptional regulator of adaptative response / DNA-3-methyladenine glycosylase II
VPPAAPDRRLAVTVDVPAPFAGGALLDFLLRHAVAGVEAGGPEPDGSVRYARTLGLSHGPATFDLRWADGGLELVVDADPRDHADAVRRVEHLVDAGAQPEVVDAHLARDPALGALVTGTPGLRVPGVLDGAEMLVRTLIGQQISLAAARTHGATLSVRHGSAAPAGQPGLERLFPTPGQLAAVDPTTPADAPGARPGARRGGGAAARRAAAARSRRPGRGRGAGLAARLPRHRAVDGGLRADAHLARPRCAAGVGPDHRPRARRAGVRGPGRVVAVPLLRHRPPLARVPPAFPPVRPSSWLCAECGDGAERGAR